MKLYGYEIKREDDEKEKELLSFVEKTEDDGAVTVVDSGFAGAGISTYLDLSGTAKSEAELVQKYRKMYQDSEIQEAVDEIVNEAIYVSDENKVVEVVLDDLELSDNIKKSIIEEFDNVLTLLKFSNSGYEVFTKWYIDGRINYHVVIDEKNPKQGIKELRYIDPRKLRKIREYEKVKIGEGVSTSFVNRLKNEYYIFTPKGFIDEANPDQSPTSYSDQNPNISGLKIAKDSIVYSNSGLLNDTNTLVISYLEKAFKPLNQLRMMEDAQLIYRVSRAPERRVFYIDVGNLPKQKAEQHIRNIMTNYKNRLSYNESTGEIRNNRRHMALTDDFYLARREGSTSTEIDTLPGGQNLGEMDDIEYFKKKLYKSLHVPVSRLESDNAFGIGRTNEISRDEVKFSKFIRRLRSRFSLLFVQILEKQLILRGIITPKEWSEIKNEIRFDFIKDNHFEELKNAEILRERLSLLRDIGEYQGRFFSKEWIMTNILQMNDEEIKEMDKQIEAEKPKEGEGNDDAENDNDKFNGNF